jgi:hypothetical protein
MAVAAKPAAAATPAPSKKLRRDKAAWTASAHPGTHMKASFDRATSCLRRLLL